MRPSYFKVVAGPLGNVEHTTVRCFRGAELARLLLHPPMVQHPLHVIRIELRGTGVKIAGAGGLGRCRQCRRLAVVFRGALGLRSGATLARFGSRYLHVDRLVGSTGAQQVGDAGGRCVAVVGLCQQRPHGGRKVQLGVGRGRLSGRATRQLTLDDLADLGFALALIGNDTNLTADHLALFERAPVEEPARAGQSDEACGDGGPDPRGAFPLALGAAIDVVGREPGEASDHLGEAKVTAVTRFAQIDAEDRHGCVGDGAVRGNLEPQRGREAVFCFPSPRPDGERGRVRGGCLLRLRLLAPLTLR